MSGITNAVIREIKGRTNAALTNEQLTRKRVDALEAQARGVDALLSRSLIGRLKWLLLGR